jgi:hypothetical protein
MRFLNNWYLFESNQFKYSSKSLIKEICVGMILINNEFLDGILDIGLKARYSENSNVFLTDLKNLLLTKNRLSLGMMKNNRFESDTEISKINSIFDSVDFDIEKDWNLLVNSRNVARSIIDKIIPNQKVSPELIKKIYWIGPNKNSSYNEDLVLELNDGNQYSIFLDKNLSSSKSGSFNLFADDLIGSDVEKMFDQDNILKWDKLAQEWIKIVYENANKKIQSHIEKFIDYKRIDSIGYFEYFDIRHRDPRFKHLGEFIEEFDKNILKFSDLMNEIWKKRDQFFIDKSLVEREWKEIKRTILHSRILENLLTSSLKSSKNDEIKKLEDGYKISSGSVKMKFIKTIVGKLGCLERNVYYVSKDGSILHRIPSRSFFRKNYENLNVKFDYHVKFNDSDSQIDDFDIKVKMELDDTDLISMNILVGFSGGEFSSNLSSKYKFDIPSDFNYQISKKDL